MKPLRLAPLANVDTHLWVLAFLLGFQLAIIARASRELHRIDTAVVDAVGAVGRAVENLAELATDALAEPEKVFVNGPGVASDAEFADSANGAEPVTFDPHVGERNITVDEPQPE